MNYPITEKLLNHGTIEENQYKKRKHDIGALETEIQEEGKLNTIFKAEHKGSKTKITLNSSHLFVKHVINLNIDKNIKKDLITIIGYLFSAFANSRDRLIQSPNDQSSILLDNLEHNWSQKTLTITQMT